MICTSYQFIKNNSNSNKNMTKIEEGIRLFRFTLLTLSGIIFVPYCALFTPKY